MSMNIFPSVNDVSGVDGEGKTLSEQYLAKRIAKLTGSDFVPSTSDFDYVGATGLNAEFKSGEAILDGYYFNIDTNTTLAMTASATNYVYLKIDKDALNNATTASGFEVISSSTVAPSNSMKIRTVVASSVAISGNTDERGVKLNAKDAVNVTGTYKGNDIDTDGDGVVNNAEQINSLNSSDIFHKQVVAGNTTNIGVVQELNTTSSRTYNLIQNVNCFGSVRAILYSSTFATWDLYQNSTLVASGTGSSSTGNPDTTDINISYDDELKFTVHSGAAIGNDIIFELGTLNRHNLTY